MRAASGGLRPPPGDPRPPLAVQGTEARAWRGRAVRGGVAVLLAVGGMAWYASRSTSLADLSDVLRAVPLRYVVTVGVLCLVNVVAYCSVLAAAVPGLGLRRATAVQLPANAVANLVPAGGAVGTGLLVVKLRSWGFTMGQVGAAMLVNGVLGAAAKVFTGLLAVLVVARSDALGAVAPIAALVGLFLAVVALLRFLASSSAVGLLARAGARVAARPHPGAGRRLLTGVVDVVMHAQRDLGALVRARWPQLIGVTLLSNVALFTLFVACVRAVGLHELDTGVLLGAFGVAQLASLIPLTPGGIGVIEVSLMATLTSKGADPNAVVAGIALYRLAGYVAPTVLGLGGLAGLGVRRRRPRAPVFMPAEGAEGAVPLVVALDVAV